MERFLMNWQEMKETFKSIVLESSGGLISATKELFNDDSQIRMQLGEEQHLFLKRDGETCFLDYFIDRRKYTKETIEQLLQSIPDRDYEKLTYYCSEHIKQRNRITTNEELEDDLISFLKLIQSISPTGKSSSSEKGNPVTISNEVSVEEILHKELTIPDYQRPYCWREENVRGFLHDIALWQMDNEKDGVNYHIGTVILKERNDGSKYDVIDGQQRLTTLAILLYCQKNDFIPPLLSQSDRHFKKAEIQTLLRARNVIQSFLEQESKKQQMNEKHHLSSFLSSVVFSVVIIAKDQPEDLAYTFFSNNNSTGKPLTDYDLLKTHHLRYINNDNAAKLLSNKWNEIEKTGYLDDLLQKMLFRLRKWKNREWFAFESANKDRHDVFDHFKSVNPLPDFVNSSFNMFRFDSLMSGGIDFFSYVDYYGKKYQEFINLEVVQQLIGKLGGYSNGVICAGIKASAFLFYCKFGDIYLKEAVYLLAYRLSEMRNRSQIRCSYLSDSSFFSPIVQALDQSASESQFFAELYDVKKRYIRVNTGEDKSNSVVKQYWESLDELMTIISNKPFVSSILIPVMVQTLPCKEQEGN